jgi:hypothetical protein
MVIGRCSLPRFVLRLRPDRTYRTYRTHRTYDLHRRPRYRMGPGGQGRPPGTEKPLYQCCGHYILRPAGGIYENRRVSAMIIQLLARTEFISHGGWCLGTAACRRASHRLLCTTVKMIEKTAILDSRLWVVLLLAGWASAARAADGRIAPVSRKPSTGPGFMPCNRPIRT